MERLKLAFIHQFPRPELLERMANSTVDSIEQMFTFTYWMSLHIVLPMPKKMQYDLLHMNKSDGEKENANFKWKKKNEKKSISRRFLFHWNEFCI